MNAIVGTALAALVLKSASEYRAFHNRASRWRGLMEKYSAAQGISPHLLAAVLWVESKFDPGAVGSVGERGMGQFKPIASEDVGIDFEQLIASPELQIEAAARLLRLNSDRLEGDFVSAVRAYNRGVGAVGRDASAGLGYATNVFRWMLVDWFWQTFGPGEKDDSSGG